MMFRPVDETCLIRVQRHPDRVAVTVRGELDRSWTGELRGVVRDVLGEGKPVILELVGLEFCDLGGLRALTELVRLGERDRAGARVEVHGARGEVVRLAELAGFEEGLLQLPQ